MSVHAGGRKVGSKVELRFYRAKGTGSKWVIDEYSSEDQNQTWVLCVMRTLSSKRKRQEMDKD
ncbi:hypothetical protein COLO4_28703 [Corchorus olitorius]|uniref:NAC domain-containing protein n=1 Tax=Corchorus olitorius TaxID=93759 RepID=A0A1R3HIR6_9ROSI|nr:hypothetical protein COLO4_28703 [Corchorus olitorius]